MIFSTFLFVLLCADNILSDSGRKAEVLYNNVPLKFDLLLYLTTQQQTSNSSISSNDNYNIVLNDLVNYIEQNMNLLKAFKRKSKETVFPI